MREHYTLRKAGQVLGLVWLIRIHPGDGPLDWLKIPDNCWLVAHIWILPASRGQGYGSSLIQMLCEEADREGATLMLEVSPDDDSPLDDRALYAFYGRYGFKPVCDAMRRDPRDPVV